MTHISADVQRITLNVSCMTISGGRTEQLDIFCRITGFTSDFLSFVDVELIRFFHGALHMMEVVVTDNWSYKTWKAAVMLSPSAYQCFCGKVTIYYNLYSVNEFFLCETNGAIYL